MHDILEKNVGRYPVAYRHYESYENYRVLNPQSTMQEYHDRSNFYSVNDCEYSEQRM